MTTIGVDITADLPVRDLVLLAQYADVRALDSVCIAEQSGRDIGIEAALVGTGTERIRVRMQLAELPREPTALMALADTLEDAVAGRIALGTPSISGTALGIESQLVLVYGTSTGFGSTNLVPSDVDPAAEEILLTSAAVDDVLGARRWIERLPSGARQPRIIARIPSSDDVTDASNRLESMVRSGVDGAIFVPRRGTASIADAVRECIEMAVDVQEAIGRA